MCIYTCDYASLRVLADLQLFYCIATRFSLIRHGELDRVEKTNMVEHHIKRKHKTRDKGGGVGIQSFKYELTKT